MTDLERALRVIRNQTKLLVKYRVGDHRPPGAWLDQLVKDTAALKEAGLL